MDFPDEAAGLLVFAGLAIGWGSNCTEEEL